jgi:hypothetical protein
VKFPGGNLSDDENHQKRQKDRRAGQVAPIQRHRHRIAAGLAKGRRQYLDEPKAEGDFRNFAENTVAHVAHLVLEFQI